MSAYSAAGFGTGVGALLEFEAALFCGLLPFVLPLEFIVHSSVLLAFSECKTSRCCRGLKFTLLWCCKRPLLTAGSATGEGVPCNGEHALTGCTVCAAAPFETAKEDMTYIYAFAAILFAINYNIGINSGATSLLGIYIRTHIFMYIHFHKYMYADTHIQMCIQIRIHIHVIYIHIYVYIYNIHVHIFTYIVATMAGGQGHHLKASIGQP